MALTYVLFLQEKPFNLIQLSYTISLLKLLTVIDMNKLVSRLFSDPLLPCHWLIAPQNTLKEHIKSSRTKIDECYQDYLFQKQCPFLKELEKRPVNITGTEIISLKILESGNSDRPLFKYRTFKVEHKSDTYQVSFSSSKARSYASILLEESLKALAKTIVCIALSILCLPMTLVGLSIRLAANLFQKPAVNRPLKVEQVSQDSPFFQNVGKIAREWQKLAQQKKAQLESKDASSIFENSVRINKLIAECIEQPDNCWWLYDKILICRDKALNEPQAIALFKSANIVTQSGKKIGSQYKITHLVTHPKNIQSKVNADEYTKVRGAATTLISHLSEKCRLEDAAGISVDASTSAVPFYKKLGFVPMGPSNVFVIESGTHPMYLQV